MYMIVYICLSLKLQYSSYFKICEVRKSSGGFFSSPQFRDRIDQLTNSQHLEVKPTIITNSKHTRGVAKREKYSEVIFSWQI